MRSVIRIAPRAPCSAQILRTISALSAATPAFGSLSQQQCTVAELAAWTGTRPAEGADVQRVLHIGSGKNQ
jgi:hypothetical protein